MLVVVFDVLVLKYLVGLRNPSLSRTVVGNSGFGGWAFFMMMTFVLNLANSMVSGLIG